MKTQTRQNATLLTKLRVMANPGLPPEELFQQLTQPEDWRTEVKKQYEVGNDDLALDVFLKHLGDRGALMDL